MTPAAPPASPRCMTIAQLAPRGGWQLGLMHDRPEHLLLWTTKGQGRVTVDGLRRGVSVHNAIFLPAGTLFSFEIGAQGFGQAVAMTPRADAALPDAPSHLRIRDAFAQSELTALLEAMQREQSGGRAFAAEALSAHAALVSVWLRRQLAAQETPAPETAAQRLVRRYCRLLVQGFRSERVMADYAAQLDVTPTHLSRVCKECAGLSAADLLTQRTLHAARSALAEPVPSVQEIAQALGFSSAAYFTRFVQHHTGQTPTALRRASQQANPARAR